MLTCRNATAPDADACRAQRCRETTAAQVLVPETYGLHEFVNADEIARGLSPFNPKGVAVQAARLMLDRIQLLIPNGESFALETTLSGRGYVHTLRQARVAGYRISLYFIFVDGPDLCVKRVAKRVAQGGHPIPKEVILRRFAKGIVNFRDVYRS